MFTTEFRGTVAPLAGLVIATAGAVLSTVIAIAAEVVRNPMKKDHFQTGEGNLAVWVKNCQ